MMMIVKEPRKQGITAQRLSGMSGIDSGFCCARNAWTVQIPKPTAIALIGDVLSE